MTNVEAQREAMFRSWAELIRKVRILKAQLGETVESRDKELCPFCGSLMARVQGHERKRKCSCWRGSFYIY